MPRWLRDFFYKTETKTHLTYALGLGLVLRLLSAYFVYGPQALDDYKHGVWPAYQAFSGLPLEIPAYRSHLLIWILAGFTHVASWFGVESAVAQVRAMYAGLALLSLTGIFGAYLFAQTIRSRLYSALVVYWMALFPLMPFISTRAFGEAVAMNLVLLAFGVLEHTRQLHPGRSLSWLAGFVILGFASLFRFHVGVLYLGYMGVLLWRKEWLGLWVSIAAGLIVTAAQGLIDILSGKGPMETLIVYLRENEGGAAKYGVSPWYNPWLFVLAVTLVPFSFAIFRNWRGLWRKTYAVIIPFLLFVTAHSLVAHKEERFLYPILGLEFLAVCYLWASASLSRWARRVYAPAVLALGALGIVVVAFVNTQEGEIEPPAYAESQYGKVTYLDHESLFGASRFQFYFLRPPSLLEKVKEDEINVHRVDEILHLRPEHRAVVLLTSKPESRDQLRALENVYTLEGHCLEMRTAGSLVDRMLFALNPKHNQRRRPTWYLVCERTSV